MNEESLAAVERLGQARLVVLGDLLLERAVRGTAQPAGVALRVTACGQVERAGGAGAVACAAAALGAQAWAAGVLGQDPQSGAVLRALAAAQVDPFAIVSLAGGATGEVLDVQWEGGESAWSGIEIELQPPPALEGEPARAMLAHLEPLLGRAGALLMVTPRAAAVEVLEAVAALARQQGKPLITGHAGGDGGLEVHHAAGGRAMVAQGGARQGRAWNHFAAAAGAAIAVGAEAEAAGAVGAAAVATAAATDPVTLAALAHQLRQA